MELLDIQVPSITRIQYANLNCKNIWEEKINRGAKLYPALEYLTVKHGIRPSMIAHNVDPHNLEFYMRKLSKDGLMLVPLSKEPVNNGHGFGHVQERYNGGPFTYRCVITSKIDIADEFSQAHLMNDDTKIGELLGFPKVSTHFFNDIWSKGYIDPIWQQAENTINNPAFKYQKEINSINGDIPKKIIRIKQIDDNWKALSAFRYIGIRLISHMPSSFNEIESIEVANNWLSLAEDLNLEGLNEVKSILQLPFEWNCLKGLAEINTPVFKILTTSVPCYPNHIVQMESDYYPKESPNGIQFPWKNPLFK